MMFSRVSFDGMNVKDYYTSWKDQRIVLVAMYSRCHRCNSNSNPKRKVIFIRDYYSLKSKAFIACNYRPLLITKNDFLMFLWGYLKLCMMLESFIYFEFTRRSCGGFFQ
jgi:hypothetical protein